MILVKLINGESVYFYDYYSEKHSIKNTNTVKLLGN